MYAPGLAALWIRRNQAAGEINNLFKKMLVGGRKLAGPLEGIPLGKRRVFPQPLFDIAALALHKVFCEFAPLLLS